MRRTIGIVGGGAAGMTAAIIAARQGACVTLFEGNERLGRKLLVTGNGKCNLGNLDLAVEKYHTDSPKQLAAWLERFGTKDTIAFFESLGLMVKQKNGYLYPLSEQAASVLDVLRFEVERRSNIRVLLQTKIDRIERDGKKNQICLWKGRQVYSFDRVILACGGKAAPKTGTDGSGYRLAGMLGHRLVPVVPALVQLRCREDWLKGVAGVRAEAELTLLEDGKEVAKERGELQLTDYGISGIPVFQLSRLANYILLKKKEPEVRINFLPETSEETFVKEQLGIRRALEKSTVEEYFTGLLNKKLMALFIRQEGLKPNQQVSGIAKERLSGVLERCSRLTVHVTGSNSFDNAQVCAGGVPLAEVTDALESKPTAGVFLAGELLDVDGRCGGYNLQWAWCSGYLTGMAAAGDDADVSG